MFPRMRLDLHICESADEPLLAGAAEGVALPFFLAVEGQRWGGEGVHLGCADGVGGVRCVGWGRVGRMRTDSGFVG